MSSSCLRFAALLSPLLAQAAQDVGHHARPLTHGIGLDSDDWFMSWRPRPTVHVLATPPELNEQLLACYHTRMDAMPWDDTRPHGVCGPSTSGVCGDHLATETAQYTADMWLHSAMMQRAAEHRVSAAEADVVWVPFYNMLSIVLGSSNCSGIGARTRSHPERIELLRQTLENSTELVTRGRHFALALPHWNVGSALGRRRDGHSAASEKLGEVLREFGVHLLITDPLFLDMGATYGVHGREESAYDACQTTILPYSPMLALQRAVADARHTEQSSGLPENLMPDGGAEDDAMLAERPMLLYFRGNTHLSRCEATAQRHDPLAQWPAYCGLRDTLIASALNASHTATGRTDVDLAGVFANGAHTPEHYEVDAVARGMRNATFCLAPRGDTGSSRRIYDAIVAGCIPVIVADDVQLAFERQLPWTNFSLRVSEADATSTPLVPYLRALPASRVASLRAGLRRVRAHFLFGVGEPFALGSTPGGASDLALRAVGAAAASDSCGTQLAQVALRQAAHKSERRSHAKARAVAVPAHSNRGKHPAAGDDATVGAHESAKVVDEILFDSAREHGSPRLHASVAYASQGADAVVRDKSADDGVLLNGETAADPASLVGKRARIVRLLARAEYNGEVGRVSEYHPNPGERYVLRLESDGKQVRVRAANLAPANDMQLGAENLSSHS